MWDSVLQSSPFTIVAAGTYKKRPHIHIGEVGAFLEAEAHVAAVTPCSRPIVIGDSQVEAGAIVKGRSASPSVNDVLVRGPPCILGVDLYSSSAWVRSHLNV